MGTERAYEFKNIPITTRLDLMKQSIRQSKKESSISPGFDLARSLTTYRSLHPSRTSQKPIELDKYLKSELRAKRNPYIPTIGLEIEIPTKITGTSPDYRPDLLCKEFNIKQAGVLAGSTYFEFCLPYSYNARTQALLLHLLIELGYIPFEEEIEPLESDTWSIRRKIPSQATFSLHCNLGIPEAINLYDAIGTQKLDFSASATNFAIACGLAYTSVERLSSRKQPRIISITKEADESVKNPKRDDNYYGRFEITTLGIGTLPTYRQFYQIQDLAAAFFAYRKSKMASEIKLDEVETDLVNLWEEASTYIKTLFEKYGLTTNLLGEQKGQLPSFLKTNDLREKVQLYLPRLAWDIHKIVHQERT